MKTSTASLATATTSKSSTSDSLPCQVGEGSVGLHGSPPSGPTESPFRLYT